MSKSSSSSLTTEQSRSVPRWLPWWRRCWLCLKASSLLIYIYGLTCSLWRDLCWRLSLSHMKTDGLTHPLTAPPIFIQRFNHVIAFCFLPLRCHDRWASCVIQLLPCHLHPVKTSITMNLGDQPGVLANLISCFYGNFIRITNGLTFLDPWVCFVLGQTDPVLLSYNNILSHI